MRSHHPLDAYCRTTDSATEGLVIRQQIRQRAQAAREARRVALTRGYRKGELPDIEQLTVSDFAEPLRALVTRSYCSQPLDAHQAYILTNHWQ